MSSCLHFIFLLLTFYTSYSATMEAYVDNVYVSNNNAFTGTSSTVTCQPSQSENLYSYAYFRLQQREADGSYRDLVSIQVSELYNSILVVYLQGMVTKLSLR